MLNTNFLTSKKVSGFILKHKIPSFLMTILFSVSLTFVWVVAQAAPYGTNLGNFNGVIVYSNENPSYASYQDNYVGGVYIGMKWQCVEYVRRYYYQIYGLDLAARHRGHAKTFWDASARMGLDRYSNNGSTAPQIGDMIVSTSGTYGHIAIVRSVSGNQVRVAQQNFTEETSDADYPLSMTVSGGIYSVSGFSSGLPITGWMRRQGTTTPVCSSGSSANFRVNGYPPVHPNGTLIKLASDPTYYLIRDGQKQGIVSQAVLEYLYDNGGFRFEDAVIVDQEEFNSYSTANSAISTTLPSNGMPKPDGTLIKKASGEISIITDNGKRRGFFSYQLFLNLGYRDCNVVQVSDSEYNSYPAGNIVDAMPKLTASMRLYDISYVGQPIRGEFTITNVGTSPFTFSKLLIGGRLNGSTITDFPFDSSITLQPGQPYTYTKFFTPQTAGSYRFFVAFQDLHGNFTTSVPKHNNAINTETITINNAPAQVSVTVGTNLAGRSFSVDGTSYTTTQTFNWVSGSSHEIIVGAIQSGGTGTRHIFNSWSDGNTQNTRTVTPTTNTTYTANFSTQHFLTMIANSGGTVSPQNGWYASGQSVPITAAPNIGFTFGNWTGAGNGSYTGANNSATVTMNAPITQTANFNGQCSYALNPTSINSPASGGVGSFNIITSLSCGWTATSNAGWLTTSSSSSGSGTIEYNVAANTGAPRSATINVGGQTFTVNQSGQTTTRRRFDFDGDGRADISVFRPSNGTWYLNQSTNGFSGINFGLSGDLIAPADYDGDGKTDVAVFRPSSGTWYLQRSQLGFTGIQFGSNGDVPMPADFDADGKADLAVFRPSTGTWYLQQSTAGFTGIQFGLNGDVPSAADYDGDGRADVAVFRPSNGVWYLNRSQAGFTGIQFGLNGDKPVPADYDADGKADLAVFRPSNGTWYLQQSTAGFTGVSFGLTDDLPVAADYDADGKTDVAVFRPSNGVWYLNRSQLGFTGIQFGTSGDKPAPNAFIP